MDLPKLPPGARLLTADEAVELLTVGDHTGSASGSVQLDAALIDMVRAGHYLVAQLADNQLAFTPAPSAPQST